MSQTGDGGGDSVGASTSPQSSFISALFQETHSTPLDAPDDVVLPTFSISPIPTSTESRSAKEQQRSMRRSKDSCDGKKGDQVFTPRIEAVFSPPVTGITLAGNAAPHTFTHEGIISQITGEVTLTFSNTGSVTIPSSSSAIFSYVPPSCPSLAKGKHGTFGCCGRAVVNSVANVIFNSVPNSATINAEFRSGCCLTITILPPFTGTLPPQSVLVVKYIVTYA